MSPADKTPKNRPTWRRLVDKVDGLVTPPADAFVRTNLFADSIAAITRLEARARRRYERQTATMIHLINLPSAGDIKSLHRQLTAVEARIRDLADQVEAAEEKKKSQKKSR